MVKIKIMKEEILKRLSDNARKAFLETESNRPGAHSDRFVRLITKGLLSDKEIRFTNDEIKYLCEADLNTMADLFPKEAESFMKMLHPDYSLYTYYAGEQENPYPADSPQARWWAGESIFDSNRLNDDDFVERLSEELDNHLKQSDDAEPAFLRDKSVPIERRALLYYLIGWNSKWFAYYDDAEYVQEYIEASIKTMRENKEYIQMLDGDPQLEYNPHTPLFYQSMSHGDRVRYYRHEPHSKKFVDIMCRFEDILDGICDPDSRGFYFSDEEIEYACKEDMRTFELFFPEEAEHYRKYLKK